MKVTYLSSTDLKRKTAEILNLVGYGEAVAIVERYGKPLVKIIPVSAKEGKMDLENRLKKYFGAIPDFPEVSKKRYFRHKKIIL